METARDKLKTVMEAKQAGKPITASDIRDELIGTPEQRNNEVKTILITLMPGNRPDVLFTGFWSAKLMKSAMNSISKAYRVRRRTMARPKGVTTNPTAELLGKKEG